MLLQVAVSKINKYATDESGDTLEMVERPHGGVSFVLVDGQRSGKSAKRISNIVARKAIVLLAEGVRDGAAARAALSATAAPALGAAAGAVATLGAAALRASTLRAAAAARAALVIGGARHHDQRGDGHQKLAYHSCHPSMVPPIGTTTVV